MGEPRPIYEAAVDYCGDPASHEGRGKMILTFLQELGLKKDSKVLNIGCGALSEGTPLINFLDKGCFVGTDPNDWLIRAALDHDPSLMGKEPDFFFDSDFTCGTRFDFDFVVCHSVLSHVAYWQMQMAMANVRKVVTEEATWLASLRLDQYTTFDPEWVYPGNSFFRWQDVMALGFEYGWDVRVRHDLRERMVELFPSDLHDWITLRAVLSPAAANSLRMELESRRQEEEEVQKIAREVYVERLKKAAA